MAATTDILKSYRAPRRVMRAHLTGGLGEERALAYVMIACFLFFISQLPELSRQIQLNPTGPQFPELASGRFLGAVIFAPLLFYGLAAISHLVAKLFGGQGLYIRARLALFWSLLAISPLVLLRGLVAGFIGQGPQLTLVNAVVAVGFLFIWINSLYEAEREPLEHPAQAD